jgi:heavy metal sensor kinase
VNARSLSFRLVAWYAAVLVVVFVCLGGLTVIFLRHYLEAGVLDTQSRRALQIADTLLAHVDRSGDALLARQVDELYSPEVNDRFIRITRADGAVVYVSQPPHDRTFVPQDVPGAGLGNAQSRVRRESLPSGSLLIGAARYPNDKSAPGNAGSYVVEVGVSTQRTDQIVRQVLLLLAIGLPVALAIAAAGGLILVRRALQPVDGIARKAEEITQHNLRERLPVLHSGDELERLSLSLNHMIARLEDAVQSSKRFVADASHELRTPLTVLRGELESLAQDGQFKADQRESLGSLLEEVDRLSKIVESLLVLSRLDAGEPSSERVRFDLGELAATTAEQISLLAQDKDIEIVCNTAADVFIEGDRARMKQVIVNLLDNAIKYTPRGGRVQLKIGREMNEAVLEVADNGIGIPADALPHMFKRFYRVDDSRSREQGGAGLGLSIVKSICAAHGASVEVSSVPGAGSSFRIRQPLASNTLLPAVVSH